MVVFWGVMNYGHGVIIRNTTMNIFTAVRTSDLLRRRYIFGAQ
jgi:hypothetical protein